MADPRHHHSPALSAAVDTAAKVRARRVALEALQQAKCVVVGTHLGPDADGIGSGLALAHGLRALGKAAFLALEEPLDARNQFFARHAGDAILVGSEVVGLASEVDLVAVVDTGRVPGGSALARLVDAAALPVVVVDHHLGGRHEPLSIIVPSSASSGEVVYAILGALGAPIGPEVAQFVYTATAYDTGSFRFLRDAVSTFRLAATLVEAGADPIQAQADLFQSTSPHSLAFLSRALGASTLDADGRYAWVALDPSDWMDLDIDREDFRDLIQHLIAVRGVDVAATLVLVPNEGKIRLSLRARTGYDVEPIMRKWGGGGHAQACGATVSGVDLGEWARKLRAAVLKRL